jgi:Raf kinase inhibitor-like YbhB/YbcL family protein
MLPTALFLAFAGCSEPTTPQEEENDPVQTSKDAGKAVDAGARKDAGKSTVVVDDPEQERDDASTGVVDAGAPPKQPAVSDAGAGQKDAATATTSDDAGSTPTAGGAFTLSSPTYQDGKAIPSTSRCMSPSPAVSWTAGPSGTRSYALTLIDVTTGISKGYVHWQIYDIPADKLELPMGLPTGAAPADIAPIKQGPNYRSTRVYTGPCGPTGTNSYELTLYALDVDTLPMLTATSTSAQVQTAIDAHDLATSVVHVTSADD